MATTKMEALASGVSNQQALVKAIISRQREPRRFVIPGGKTMLSDLDARNLTSAIYTWLRGVRTFDSVKINLLTDTTAIKTRTYRSSEFPETPSPYRAWDRQDLGGKRWLAERLAGALADNVVISIEARADGLYLTVPETPIKAEELQAQDSWGPYLEFVVRGQGEYKI